MRTWIFACLTVAVACPAVSLGQSLSQRIEEYKRKQNQSSAPVGDAAASLARTIESRLGDRIDPVKIENAPAEAAFKWWARTAGIPMLIDWQALALDGVDQETRVNVDLRHAPAGVVLSILMRQVAPEGVPLMYETTPHYLEVMTRRQANQRTVVRVYDIGDLLAEIPQFTNAPRMDLGSALGGSNNGGNNSSGNSNSSDSNSGSRGRTNFGTQNLFEQQTTTSETATRTRAERGEELADLIRDTIEPDVWIERGGQYSSIRVFGSRLIINAPPYVHRQIGMPVRSSVTGMTGAGAAPLPPASGAATVPTSKGVGGVQSNHATTRVGGVAE